MSVGVFQGHAVDEILAVVDGLGLDAAQLHGNSTGSLETVAARVATTITAVQVDGADLPAFEHESVDIVMLDAAEPGSGAPFEWTAVGDLVDRHRVLLAGGLRPDNVAEAIGLVRRWGVDVASGVECASGVKDPELIRRFVSEARAASGGAPRS